MEEVDAKLAWHKADECSQRLAKIPNVGPIGAMLEHFSSLLNRAGFPRRGKSDSSCVLAEEAGMHGECAVG
jgi:hypothetical protein